MSGAIQPNPISGESPLWEETTRVVRSVWQDTAPLTAPLDETIRPPLEIPRPDIESILPRRVVRAAGEARVAGFSEYSLLDVLGKGGMGVVYEATQTSVHRSVAVKILSEAAGEDEHNRTAFLSEAIITGNLDHPNIVPIHELAKDGEGRLFFVMKRIRGVTWRTKIHSLPLEENLDVLFKVMDAVAFAHSRGVIHLDLKPDNVMLGDFGEVLLTDWGVAVTLGDSFSNLPQRPPTLGGTPSYMAPEMARGELGRLGVHTDVYLLGGLLWEIVTGKRPHGGLTVLECLVEAGINNIQTSDRQGELIDIALIAMSTKPRRRFKSVSAFRQAIKSYLSHDESHRLNNRALQEMQAAVASGSYDGHAQAIFGFREALKMWPDNVQARENLSQAALAYAQTAVSKGDLDLAASQLAPDDPQHQDLRAVVETARQERLARQKRMRFLTRVSAGLAAFVMVVLGVAFFWIRSEREGALAARNAEARQRLTAEGERDRAERACYLSSIGEIDRLVQRGKTADALTALAALPARFRGWEYGHLAALCRRLDPRGPRILAGHADKVMGLNFFPDGRRLASGSKDSTVRIWDAQTGAEVKILHARMPWTGVPAVDRQGRFLVSGSGEVWDLATFSLRCTLAESSGGIYNLVISPDGRQVAGFDENDRLLVWDLATGVKRAALREGKSFGLGLAYSSDGKMVMYGTKSGEIRFCDAVSGRVLRSATVDASPMGNLAVNPVSQIVAGASMSGVHKAFGVADGKLRCTYEGFGGKIVAQAYTPDGRWLIGNCTDGMLRVWEALTGRLSTEIRGVPGVGTALAVAPDGKRVAAGGYDRTVRVWEWREKTAAFPIRLSPAGDVFAAFQGRDTQLVAVGSDGQVREWQAGRPTSTVVLRLEGSPSALSVSADGRQIAAAVKNQPQVHCFATRSGPPAKAFPLPEGLASAIPLQPTALAFLPGGERIAVGDSTGRAYLLDPQTGVWTFCFQMSDQGIGDVCVSRDGRRIAWSDRTGAVRLVDAGTGQALRTIPGDPDYFISLIRGGFSPDGRYFAVGRADKTIVVYDVNTGAPVSTLKGHTGWCVVAFSPDGNRLVSAGTDGVFLIWDWQSGRALIAQSPGDGPLSAAAFGADGCWVLTAGKSGIIRLWNSLAAEPVAEKM